MKKNKSYSFIHVHPTSNFAATRSRANHHLKQWYKATKEVAKEHRDRLVNVVGKPTQWLRRHPSQFDACSTKSAPSKLQGRSVSINPDNFSLSSSCQIDSPTLSSSINSSICSTDESPHDLGIVTLPPTPLLTPLLHSHDSSTVYASSVVSLSTSSPTVSEYPAQSSLDCECNPISISTTDLSPITATLPSSLPCSPVSLSDHACVPAPCSPPSPSPSSAAVSARPHSVVVQALILCATVHEIIQQVILTMYILAYIAFFTMLLHLLVSVPLPRTTPMQPGSPRRIIDSTESQTHMAQRDPTTIATVTSVNHVGNPSQKTTYSTHFVTNIYGIQSLRPEIQELWKTHNLILQRTYGQRMQPSKRATPCARTVAVEPTGRHPALMNLIKDVLKYTSTNTIYSSQFKHVAEQLNAYIETVPSELHR
ncbi:uncharacterized protein BYT42DRAFT_612328 [Radiomyces spectabilis]|uniref:uncharacterized protein n=1 Tax=Radiomyces spectabilis TaxID=64574 RepID=UPI0022207A61|nr:uncharacterized protein BYT42DRAFT_612328 [Radiomyces spectabilis]KAI8384642.1 hypothetical protein BYT42DRAFT_612328 [Radiomyces spectabilis]